jgi:hypothetical protein
MTETIQYSVIKKAKPFELRRYPTHIKAEVEVAGLNYQQAIYQGFRILAGYIFGDNIETEQIAMTSPVQVSNPKTVEMTKPVTVRGDGAFWVAFIMPAKYTLETLPQPKDRRIHLTKIDSEVVAVLRFSGYFSENSVGNAKRRLQDWLAQEGLESAGDFTIARYNPPWVPFFFARNEVMIQIKDDPDPS